jgi:hypothetical protein
VDDVQSGPSLTHHLNTTGLRVPQPRLEARITRVRRKALPRSVFSVPEIFFLRHEIGPGLLISRLRYLDFPLFIIIIIIIIIITILLTLILIDGWISSGVFSTLFQEILINKLGNMCII